MKLLGLLSLIFYAIHAGVYVARRQPENLLWACHVGALVVGAGLLIGSPTVNAIGAFWLGVGVPLWLFYLATGGDFMPTSIGTHGGGLVIGYVGMRRLGLPRGVWWKSFVAWFVLCVVVRVVTPPEANINLVHDVMRGWEAGFASYTLYALMIAAICLGGALAQQFALPKLGFQEPRP